MKAVKHFRVEGADKKYLLALLPIDFGKLVSSCTADPAVATEGFFLLVIDDDAYVEADPYGWVSKDMDLAYLHFYLRDNATKLRGGTVLQMDAIRKEVAEVVARLTKPRANNDELHPKSAAPATTATPSAEAA